MQMHLYMKYSIVNIVRITHLNHLYFTRYYVNVHFKCNLSYNKVN